MRDLTDFALDTARLRGATYADIRIVHRRTQHVEVRNGAVSHLAEAETHGFGVRVVADGAWGFAASSTLTRALREPVDLGPPEVWTPTGHPRSPTPVTVPLRPDSATFRWGARRNGARNP